MCCGRIGELLDFAGCDIHAEEIVLFVASNIFREHDVGIVLGPDETGTERFWHVALAHLLRSAIGQIDGVEFHGSGYVPVECQTVPIVGYGREVDTGQMHDVFELNSMRWHSQSPL